MKEIKLRKKTILNKKYHFLLSINATRQAITNGLNHRRLRLYFI